MNRLITIISLIFILLFVVECEDNAIEPNLNSDFKMYDVFSGKELIYQIDTIEISIYFIENATNQYNIQNSYPEPVISNKIICRAEAISGGNVFYGTSGSLKVAKENNLYSGSLTLVLKSLNSELIEIEDLTFTNLPVNTIEINGCLPKDIHSGNFPLYSYHYNYLGKLRHLVFGETGQGFSYSFNYINNNLSHMTIAQDNPGSVGVDAYTIAIENQKLKKVTKICLSSTCDTYSEEFFYQQDRVIRMDVHQMDFLVYSENLIYDGDNIVASESDVAQITFEDFDSQKSYARIIATHIDPSLNNVGLFAFGPSPSPGGKNNPLSKRYQGGVFDLRYTYQYEEDGKGNLARVIENHEGFSSVLSITYFNCD